MTPLRRAITLVEVLVSIGVMGVLLAIGLPALMRARAGGGQTVSLANARTCAMDIAAYAEQEGEWPFVKPGRPVAGVPPHLSTPDLFMLPGSSPGTFVGSNDVWLLRRMWALLVAARVAPWQEHYQAWVSPGRTADLDAGNVSVSYEYSNSFQARPELWTPEFNPASSADPIQPVRSHEVAHPSVKVLVWDGDLAYLSPEPKVRLGHPDAPTPAAFADMHAAVIRPQEATPGFPNALNSARPDAPLHNTPGGVRGSDY